MPQSLPVPDFIAGMLGKLMRFELTDGRVVVGRCLCTDRDCNIVLQDCQEVLPSSAENQERYIGLSLVTGKTIVAAAMLAEDLELLPPAAPAAAAAAH